MQDMGKDLVHLAMVYMKKILLENSCKNKRAFIAIWN
jgi:hypothetical protein